MTDRAQTFASLIASERTRIGKEREKLQAKKAELDVQIAALDQELKAISAYETVKSGRAVTAKGTSSSGGGIRRSGQREAVLALIKAHPNGISPANVLNGMNATSDADKTSVRNALSALKKAGSVDTKDGNYFAK